MKQDVLFYKYKVLCPRCKDMSNQWIIVDGKPEDVIALGIKCNCRYDGPATSIYLGREYKPVDSNSYMGKLLNSDIVDKS